MMKFTLFIGCNIPPRVPHYELSARAVSDKLDVELVDIPDFGCCGYPMRNTDFKAYILFSARNIALAENSWGKETDVILARIIYHSDQYPWIPFFRIFQISQ